MGVLQVEGYIEYLQLRLGISVPASELAVSKYATNAVEICFAPHDKFGSESIGASGTVGASRVYGRHSICICDCGGDGRAQRRFSHMVRLCLRRWAAAAASSRTEACLLYRRRGALDRQRKALTLQLWVYRVRRNTTVRLLAVARQELMLQLCLGSLRQNAAISRAAARAAARAEQKTIFHRLEEEQAMLRRWEVEAAAASAAAVAAAAAAAAAAGKDKIQQVCVQETYAEETKYPRELKYQNDVVSVCFRAVNGIDAQLSNVPQNWNMSPGAVDGCHGGCEPGEGQPVAADAFVETSGIFKCSPTTDGGFSSHLPYLASQAAADGAPATKRHLLSAGGGETAKAQELRAEEAFLPAPCVDGSNDSGATGGLEGSDGQQPVNRSHSKAFNFARTALAAVQFPCISDASTVEAKVCGLHCDRTLSPAAAKNSSPKRKCREADCGILRAMKLEHPVVSATSGCSGARRGLEKGGEAVIGGILEGICAASGLVPAGVDARFSSHVTVMSEDKHDAGDWLLCDHNSSPNHESKYLVDCDGGNLLRGMVGSGKGVCDSPDSHYVDGKGVAPLLAEHFLPLFLARAPPQPAGWLPFSGAGLVIDVPLTASPGPKSEKSFLAEATQMGSGHNTPCHESSHKSDVPPMPSGEASESTGLPDMNNRAAEAATGDIEALECIMAEERLRARTKQVRAPDGALEQASSAEVDMEFSTGEIIDACMGMQAQWTMVEAASYQVAEAMFEVTAGATEKAEIAGTWMASVTSKEAATPTTIVCEAAPAITAIGVAATVIAAPDKSAIATHDRSKEKSTGLLLAGGGCSSECGRDAYVARSCNECLVLRKKLSFCLQVAPHEDDPLRLL